MILIFREIGMVGNLILQSRDKNILTVTVNRPEKANSLTIEMLDELAFIFKIEREK